MYTHYYLMNKVHTIILIIYLLPQHTIKQWLNHSGLRLVWPAGMVWGRCDLWVWWGEVEQLGAVHCGPGWWFFRSPLCYHLQESFFYVISPDFCRQRGNSIRFSIVAQGAEIWPIWPFLPWADFRGIGAELGDEDQRTESSSRAELKLEKT